MTMETDKDQWCIDGEDVSRITARESPRALLMCAALGKVH